MIFFIILLAIFFILLAVFAVRLDKLYGNEAGRVLINAILLLELATLCICIMLICSLMGNIRLQLLLGKCMIFSLGAFSVYTASCCLRFPRFRRSPVSGVCIAVLDLCVFYIAFIGIEAIYFDGGELRIVALKTGLGTTSWIDIFVSVFAVYMSVVCELITLIRAVFEKSKMTRQKLCFLTGGILLSQALILLLMYASAEEPLFITFYPFVLALFVVIVYLSVSVSVLMDLGQIAFKALEIICQYGLPAAAAGGLAVLLYPLRFRSLSAFLFLSIFFTALLLIGSYRLGAVLKRKIATRATKYLSRFEENLSAIDYSGDGRAILERFASIITRAVDTTSVSVLIDFGNGRLETAYSSSGKTLSLPADWKIVDTLHNNRISVVLLSHIDSKHGLEPVRKGLEAFFSKTESEAFIMLSEGRRMFGFVLLGKKRLGNMYTDYDYHAFNTLYSYFFVAGYYVRNIANKDIVGTINREIKMSAQIIRSIQQNTDMAGRGNLDIGAQLIPAHEIGSEIIDFIWLSPTRSLFVVGAISGKGLTASITMVMMKSLIRTFLHETRDFKSFVQRLNRYIRFELPHGDFFSGVFGIIDYSDNMLYYINCGVSAMFLYTQVYNNVIEIQGAGRVLGFVKDIKSLLSVRTIQLTEGDTLFICTPGLIQARSPRGDRFGKDRILQEIMANLQYPASKIASFAYEAAKNFASRPLEDDVSILVIKGPAGRGS